uniref:Nitrilotriacetate monooxygenase component A n=1 Tax=uncultured bacterium AB_9 TaxID=1630012 RepID=A0A0E3JNM1_9BACT|nr:nitrilotriacetate monooxygenase component A [uncultured bacterium AB_9]
MHLNAFLMGVGHHESAWRLPESDPVAYLDVRHYQEQARIAEAGKLDSLFLADGPALWDDLGRQPPGALEPTLLLTAMAVTTSRIGLIATASTTYNQPYNLARRFASLDHISGGRAGWNVVTTAGLGAALNFGLDELPSHEERYSRAAEFIEVSRSLWDSWADDATLGDKRNGVWGDNDKIYPPRHAGEHFRVAGALNVPRPPQGHPVLVQAGSSETGRQFAARFAEIVFTAQQDPARARDFYADVKRRVAVCGRDPATVQVLPGLAPVIAGTESAARARLAELAELVRPEYGLPLLAELLAVAPEELSLERELPAHLPSEEAVEGSKSRRTLVVEMGRRERLTVRQLLGRLAASRGHYTVAGTPEQVAEAMAEWFTTGAADGFNVMPVVLPSGLTDFVDQVVPLLRRRGLFRDDYEHATLRGHYGLPRPAHPRAGLRQAATAPTL